MKVWWLLLNPATGSKWGSSGDSRVKLKNFGLFISEEQMNSLKQKKSSKLIYSECKLNANML